MVLFRRLILALLVLLALGYAALTLAERDSAATHPALQSLPDTIPVRDFYAQLGAEWGFEPSSDGTMVVFWKRHFSGNVLTLRDARTGKDIAEIPEAEHAYWSPREGLVRFMAEGRLWEADPARPNRDDWKDVSPRGITAWNLAGEALAGEGRNLVLSYDRSQIWPDLFTTDPSGRDLQRLADNDDKTLYWLLDGKAKIHGRVVLAEDGGKVLERAEADGRYSEVLRAGHDDILDALDLSADGKTLAILTNIGADLVTLQSIDLATGVRTPVAGFDRVDVAITYDLTPFDGQIDLIVGDDLVQEFKAMTDRGRALLAAIKAEGMPVDLSYLAVNGDGRFVTMTLSPKARSYVYRLVDLNSGTVSDLGTFAFGKDHGPDLAETTGHMVSARDGMQIPVYVVRPKGVTAPGPTLVEVHGGPEHHSRWEYRHFLQLLANRGYTVVSVNYRGSNGWGRTFRDAGRGAYGTTIQEDIVDVAKWAVDQGLADPEAMAVTGDSFGGYAAVMALTRDDNPFKAGIAIVPMLDVEFQSRNAPAFWGADPKGWARYFGDWQDPAAAEVMRQRSPVNLANKVKAPLLLLAGRQDTIVNIEQVERFDEAMREAGHPPELHIFDEEGHGWDDWKAMVRESRLTEDFLARHLGGASGGWDFVELLLP